MRKTFIKTLSVHSFMRPHWPRGAVVSTTFHLSNVCVCVGGVLSEPVQSHGVLDRTFVSLQNSCVMKSFLQCDDIEGGGILRGD